MDQQNLYQATRVELLSNKENYGIFSLRGRIGRCRYLCYALVHNIALSVIAVILSVVLFMVLGERQQQTIQFIMYTVIFISYIVSLVSLSIRRLNDIGRSSKLAGLLLVPPINLFLGMYLLFKPGMKTENIYGIPPDKNTFFVYAGIVLLLVLPIVVLVVRLLPAN